LARRRWVARPVSGEFSVVNSAWSTSSRMPDWRAALCAP